MFWNMFKKRSKNADAGARAAPRDDQQSGAAAAEATPPTSGSAHIEAQIRDVIDSFRPFIQGDGGDIDYLGFDKGVVKVRLKGACVGCPSSFMTLQMGIERHLIERIPQVHRVENVG